MTATRIIDDHLELANIGTNSHAQIDAHIAAADDYIKRDGSLALTSDWDIGDTRKVLADEIRARDAAGLKLYDDGGNGVFVKDGGNVGVLTDNPGVAFQIGKTDETGNPEFKIYGLRPGTGVHNGKMYINTWGNFVIQSSRAINLDAAQELQITGSLFNLNNATGIRINDSDTSHTYRMFKFGSGSDYSMGYYPTDDTFQFVDGNRINTNVRMVLDSAGNIGIGTTSPTAKLDINSDIFRVRTAKTPASAGAAGNQGDVCWDASYIYVCTATNSWERAAIAAW